MKKALFATALVGGMMAIAPVQATIVTGSAPYLCFDAGQAGGTNNLGSVADSSVGAPQHQLGAFSGAGCVSGVNDSPFKGVPGSPNATWYFVEDFEDSGQTGINTPGMVVNGGRLIPPGFANVHIDSVDADDGVVDGFGQNGHTWFVDRGQDGIKFTFDENDPALNGFFPTHAGLVWTDGNAVDVQFTVFDQDDNVIESITVLVGDNNFNGGTAEDLFFGAIVQSGIGGIEIRALSGGNGLEVDHVQFGRLTGVAEPGTLALIGVGLLGLGALRRRQR